MLFRSLMMKIIMDSISGLQQENADKIVQVVEKTKEGLSKPVPSVSRLGKCLLACIYIEKKSCYRRHK